jgi:hypothetical protein
MVEEWCLQIEKVQMAEEQMAEEWWFQMAEEWCLQMVKVMEDQMAEV